jgi:putative CocE/NonD family hydrolase
VLVEDLRGTGGSQGELLPYAHAVDDGRATLDWIAAQPWSNGRVGTYGCSALGETQYVLARTQHPALRAMIPLGAGGAIGSAAGRYSYFGLWEGGVFELASGFGWFVDHGATTPAVPAAGVFDRAAALRQLPVAGLVARYRPGPNGYDAFLERPLADPGWHDLGYLDDTDVPRVPVLDITTWGDQTLGDTLAFHASLPAKYAALGITPPERHLVIAPGTHCHAADAGETGHFGEARVPNANEPYFEWYERWFDHWLRDRGPGLADLPPVQYYMINEARWLSAPSWPPPESRVARWYLDGAGHANGSAGDGHLGPEIPEAVAVDAFVDDPDDPVPSLGGPICCTGNAHEPSGPHDQRSVESRQDVLVYTSAPLGKPLRIAGPLRAHLVVSSSAPDTDIVVRLTDVSPDGHSMSMQEGALRARYRGGIAHAEPLVPGRPVTLEVDLRAIAWRVPAGHRLRVDIAGTAFPRLERNLHGGTDNDRESKITRATNRVHHGGEMLSWIELPLLPESDGTGVRIVAAPASGDSRSE